MKAKIQVFTPKGFYGPELEVQCSFVSEVSMAVVEAMEKMPDQLEGEKLVNWNQITVIISR